MKSSSFKKRLIAMTIDIFMISLLFYVVAYCYAFTIFQDEAVSSVGVLSFLPITAILYPYQIIFFCFGNSIEVIISISFFTVELLYYFVFEASPLNATLGHKIMGIQTVDKTNSRLALKSIVIRCLLKTISRYLYCLPMLLACFTKHNQAFHDILVNSVVVDRK